MNLKENEITIVADNTWAMLIKVEDAQRGNQTPYNIIGKKFQCDIKINHIQNLPELRANGDVKIIQDLEINFETHNLFIIKL